MGKLLCGLNFAIFILCGCTSHINHPHPSQMPVPAVAKSYYREHLWYSVFTRPDLYFRDIELQKYKKDNGPVRILAIGDSWFAYPKQFGFFDFLFSPPSNVLTNLVNIGESGNFPEYRILSLSNSGETAANMAGLSEQDPIDFIESIQKDVSIPWVIARSLRESTCVGSECINKPFEYILISAGGNDMVSPRRIKSFLRYKNCHQPKNPISCIDENALDELFSRIGVFYERLISIISEQPGFSNVPIIAHTYDDFVPMPIGAKFLSGIVTVGEHGWVYPLLEAQNIRAPDAQILVAQKLLDRFRTELNRVADRHPGRFLVVDTRGTLRELGAKIELREHVERTDADENVLATSPKSLWVNEIHPDSLGFKCVALRIHEAILNHRNVKLFGASHSIDEELIAGCRCPKGTRPTSELLSKYPEEPGALRRFSCTTDHSLN